MSETGKALPRLRARAALAWRAFRGVEPTYPTAWAYERACTALWRHRERAEGAEDCIRRVLALRSSHDGHPLVANHQARRMLESGLRELEEGSLHA